MKKHFGTGLLTFLVALASLLQFWPDAMLHVWLLMPEDLKASLPPVAVKWFSYVLMVASFLGKMHSMRREQKALRKQVDDSVSQ